MFIFFRDIRGTLIILVHAVPKGQTANRIFIMQQFNILLFHLFLTLKK